jgi:hypothetical protein
VEASSGVPEVQTVETLLAIKAALESGGVQFIGSPDDDPGVRLLTSTTKAEKAGS